jgi:hypothetical protein
MVFTFTTRLLDLGFEQERAFHHHCLTGLQTGDDLNLTTEITAASNQANLEPVFPTWKERAPAFLQSL